jgi:hypothetical protein
MRPAADVRRGSDDEVAAVYFMIVSPSFRKVVGVLFIGAVALIGWFLIHNPDTSEQWNSQRPEHAESVPAEIKAQDSEFADVAGATATAWA